MLMKLKIVFSEVGRQNGGAIRAVTSPAMSAYVVYEAVITDAEQYERYKALAAPSVAAAGGRYLARGGEVETFEGATPARVVVLEFPTLEAAREWYRGEQYTAARALREAACDARMFVVDGMA
jgi:uncharacterized protein (DUF1330 family)